MHLTHHRSDWGGGISIKISRIYTHVSQTSNEAASACHEHEAFSQNHIFTQSRISNRDKISFKPRAADKLKSFLMSMLDPNNSLSPLVDPNPGLYSSLTDSQRQSPRQSPRRPDDREAHSSLPNLALIPDTHHDPKSDHQNDSLRWRWALCGVRSVPKFRALLNPSSRRCAPIRSRLVDLNQATSDRGAILPEFYSENCGHGAGPVRQDCDSDASVWDEDVIGIRDDPVKKNTFKDQFLAVLKSQQSEVNFCIH